jgi:hypothetical protein
MSFKWRGWRVSRPRVLAGAAVTAAVAIALAGLVFSQARSAGRRQVATAPTTTALPALPLLVEPSTTATTIADPSGTEPPIPATPTPPPGVPVLTSNSIFAPIFYRLHLSVPVVFVTIDDGWVRDPRVNGERSHHVRVPRQPAAFTHHVDIDHDRPASIATAVDVEGLESVGSSAEISCWW